MFGWLYSANALQLSALAFACFLARIRRGPPVPHLAGQFVLQVDWNGEAPDSPRNPGKAALSATPRPPFGRGRPFTVCQPKLAQDEWL